MVHGKTKIEVDQAEKKGKAYNRYHKKRGKILESKRKKNIML